MWSHNGAQSNGGSTPDESCTTNPFFSAKGQLEEGTASTDANQGQQTGGEADFLSRLNVKNVFNRLSTKSNEPKKVRSKVWNHVVNVVLVEGRDLLPKADNTLPDPFVKFKLGTERYKSKSKPKTLSPKWMEQLTLYAFEDQKPVLEISVRDTEIGGREVVLGSMTIDLEDLEKEKTHRMEGHLKDDAGTLTLLVTVCSMTSDHPLQQPRSPSGSSSPGSTPTADLSPTISLQNTTSRQTIAAQYKFAKSFKNFRDLGWLQVKVLKAHGLAAVDMGGKSDPFCVLELVNSRLQTQTIYKCLTPEWNKTFTFTVFDIHSVLEVTVFDENPDKKMDFLGKIAIPLLKIRPGERRWYQLKDIRLMSRGKGVIQLELDFIFNTFKAVVRTFNPREPKYTSPEPKFRVSIMKRNIDRVSKIAQSAVETGKFVQSCFNWDSKLRSAVAFAVFLVMILCLELYMIPASLAVVFLKNLLVLNVVEGFKMEKEANDSNDDDFDEDEDLEKAEKSKGFVEKLQSIQDVCLQVQETMDQVATLAERGKNALTWKVPWLSWLALFVLVVATVLLYFVPLRYIIMAWGINKFTKKLRSPNAVDNNELLDFLSRAPSDKELMQYRELKPDAGVQAAIRKKQQ